MFHRQSLKQKVLSKCVSWLLMISSITEEDIMTIFSKSHYDNLTIINIYIYI